MANQSQGAATMRDHFAAFRKQREAPAHQAPEAANSNHDPDELEERAAMAAEGGVPAPYVDAFARMQVVHPIRLSWDEWARMVDDASRFLDAWGEAAVGLGWTVDDLFGDGKLAAALKGTTVTALSSEMATLSDGRIYRPLDRSAAADNLSSDTNDQRHSPSPPIPSS